MKHYITYPLVLAMLIISCKQQDSNSLNESKIERISLPLENKKEETPLIKNENNNDEIQKLIREVLLWADSDDAFNLLPAITNGSDSIYIGFNLQTHKQNLNKLWESNLFTKDFIENYNDIILNINNKLKTNGFEHGPWHVGSYPPFRFSQDANAWCFCQDVPYDDPDPWSMVEIEEISSQKYAWKWGNLDKRINDSWSEFRYQFEVKNEGERWKISYMEGFDIRNIYYHIDR